MRRQINIALLLLLTIFLTSCFTSKEEVNEAKREMGIVVTEKEEVKDTESTKPSKAVEDLFEENMNKFESDKEKEVPLFEIEFLDEQKIELDDLEGKTITDTGLKLTGKALEHVDSITVEYKNDYSDFPDDRYTLKKFKSGDETFSYGAYKKYKTMDFGKNVYTFIAKVGDEEYKTQLTINIENPEDKEEDREDGTDDGSYEAISDNKDLISNTDAIQNLPEGDKFGNIVDLGNGNITYSDIRGLEIKITDKELTCDSDEITSYLADEINGWFYWNTCRPISGDKGVSVFVIRLTGEDEYIYEKHYFSNNGLSGIQELKKGTGVTKSNISSKNTELKETNSNYTILEIVDDLFKKIIN